MSNPTNAADTARPTPDTSDMSDTSDTSDGEASSDGQAKSSDSTETRPLTGPTLVLPALRDTTTAGSAEAPTAPASHPEPTVPPEPTESAAPFAWEQPPASARHRPRCVTILCGALLLGFGVFMGAGTLFPGTLDPTLWLLAAVIGVGLVLVVAGIAAATRRAD